MNQKLDEIVAIGLPYLVTGVIIGFLIGHFLTIIAMNTPVGFQMKRIIVQTVYENCTDEFVEDYINHLCTHNDMLKEGKEDFLKGETIGFLSEDPTSPCIGVTQYKLEDMP